jgi:hypothetical protein
VKRGQCDATRRVVKGDATCGKGGRDRGYAWRRRGRATGRGRHLKRGQCDARQRGRSQGNGREGKGQQGKRKKNKGRTLDALGGLSVVPRVRDRKSTAS